MKTSYKILISLLLFYSCSMNSQKLQDWILSGRSTIANYNTYGPQIGFGFDAEYFLVKNVSVRGGITMNNNFMKITPAPFFWCAMAEGRYRTGRYHHPMNLKAYLTLLSLSDGFSFYIPVTKKLYFTPYVAPLQLVFTRQIGNSNFIGNMFSSVGLGLKYINTNNFTADFSIEYNRTAITHSSLQGISCNFSIGYKINRRHPVVS